LHPEPSYSNSFEDQDLGCDSSFGAVSTLHGAVAEFRGVTPIDAELGIVISAWDRLSGETRREILAIVAAATIALESRS